MTVAMQAKWLNPGVAAVAFALMLAGCANSGYRAPVEDHSGGNQPAPGTVVPAEPSEGVTVSPVEEIQIYDDSESPASQSSDEQGAAPTDNKADQQGQGTRSASSSSQNAAVVALLQRARTQTGSGQYQQAQQQLERAQRIAPRDPQVYYQLADVHRRLGQFMQAEQVALKGVNAAEGQPAQQRRLWNLIALIRSDGGDAAGARQAQQKAAGY